VITASSSSGARRAGEPSSALSRPWRYSGEFEGALRSGRAGTLAPSLAPSRQLSNNTYSSGKMIRLKRVIARGQFT